jgi:PAS domain S-box-containing protein
MSARQHDAEILLRTEHAVARVLTDASDEESAYPRILEAIGSALGWDTGAVWQLHDTALERIATWNMPDPFDATWLHAGEGLPGAVYTSGGPAWIADVTADEHLPRGKSALAAGLHAAFAFPITGTDGILAVAEFLAREQREPDDALLATMTSLGGRIGQTVERRRAEERLKESDARKTAILDAAFDAVITMDGDGNVVEVNRATERMFGYTAGEMVGKDLAELIIPPALREPHRRGLQRHVETGRGRMLGHPVELPGMHADGTEFPVEIAITRPRLTGPPLFTGYIRDVTQRQRDEQELRALAEQQAALRRVATAVAGEHDPERVFAVATEEVGRLLGASTSNMVRFEEDGTATVTGAWSEGGAESVRPGTRLALDGPTAATRIHATGRPARVDDFTGLPGTDAALLRGAHLSAAVGAPIFLSGRLWGAVMVSTTEPAPFPPGAEQRIADFAELVALAMANAQAREDLAASRARIVAAQDDERRRLERNLHDGAQQRLVALALMLRVAEAKTDGEAKTLLHSAGAELADALAELRELARGIHPSILTDRGLVPALEMLAGRASLPVALNVDVAERLPRPVEAAAYYIVAEALTNASKHAAAGEARVDLTRTDGVVLVSVTDDGVGGADVRGGSGVRGLADRVDALGGTLAFESPPGGGTRVSARIPCAG